LLAFKIGVIMDLDKIHSNDDLYVEDGFWKFRWRGETTIASPHRQSIDAGSSETQQQPGRL